MAGLKLENVNKIYPNGFHAVHDMNLEITDNEFIVFVGPSGCGKSTALRMIAGLEEISSGELYIGDRLVNNVSPKDRDIAMVFQNYALYPHMTNYENMAFGLKLRNVPKDEIDKSVKYAAGILGLENLLDRKPRELSGGQRQRIALGRAIVRDPQVFLMDEPLSNLDAKLRVQTRAEISKLHQKLKTTFIYVTHDQTEAMTMGTRIVVLKDGYVMQVDTPTNLYENPKNMFVGGFIGSPQMNFIEGEFIDENGELYFQYHGGKVTLQNEKAKVIRSLKQTEKKTVMGIRPEHLEVVVTEAKESDDTGNDNNQALVEVTEMLGSETYLFLKIKQDQSIVARVEPSVKVAVNDTVTINPRKDKMHFFHPETEESLLK
ncbi:carbohydrate ABC transporter ATP-binding protein, CUT1 family [Tindallia magadiensis]|uniref:Carbohydrate ABC transporter ATP-binding protein, CUT1 family n=1 Tax=Tindallia magadiensis TaxID=69895 RepID=A0A1I3ANV1_9FIRM|nr:sn-glycerol-3-phosphate ABC transporter ATP-binding protein UgpC [Tindallia magadiensis]SFH51828.1 carbohydrate ABC transporter ATP-binding protein, CUT1 family [Tindallia magadiensis]